MNATELRLGNWVNCHFQTTNFNAKVLAISLTNDISVMDGNRVNQYGSEGNVDPIPLTPEILEKAGFEAGLRASIIRVWIKGNFIINDHDGLNFQWKCLTEVAIIELKYVHQLQNLCHSLTGNELNIQL